MINNLHKIGLEVAKKPTTILCCDYDQKGSGFTNVKNSHVFAQMFLDEAIKAEVSVAG